MRLFKSLIIMGCLTLAALAYVHQQVELVKMSYAINYKERKLKDILDRRDCLGYNIANLENPSRLESVLLAKKIDISFPKPDHVFKIVRISSRGIIDGSSKVVGIERKGALSGIFEFFGLRAEAQAGEK